MFSSDIIVSVFKKKVNIIKKIYKTSYLNKYHFINEKNSK